jgi:hypothetical protein
MEDKKPYPDQAERSDQGVTRSFSEVAQAVGVVTGGVGTGVGTLMVGVAKIKDAFGNESTPPPRLRRNSGRP